MPPVNAGRSSCFTRNPDSWNTYVVDGHDVEELCKALWQAEQDKSRPTAIVAKTFKGRGLKGEACWGGGGQSIKDEQMSAAVSREMPDWQTKICVCLWGSCVVFLFKLPIFMEEKQIKKYI